MLKSLLIDNYRCFTNFEFRPDQVNLLLGSNGSGKSSLFDVLQAVRDLVAGGKPVEAAFPGHEVCKWQNSNIQRVRIEVEENDATYSYELVVEHNVELRKPSIKREELLRETKPLYLFDGSQVHLYGDDHVEGPVFESGSQRSFLAQYEPSSSHRSLAWWKNWIRGVWFFRLDPRKIAESWVTGQEDLSLSDNGSNFGSFFREFVQQRPDLAPLVNSELSSCIASFVFLRLQPIGTNKGLLAVFAPEGQSQYELPLAQLSDGQRIIIVLQTILQLIGHRITLLCMDEPENYLALGEIQPWLQNLTRIVVEKNCQTMVVSHNPEVIDYLGADSPFLFQRPGGSVSRASRALFDRDSGIKASEQLARGIENVEP